jgi:spore coat protein H
MNALRALTTLLLGATLAAGQAAAASDKKATDELFGQPRVLRLSIEVPAAGLESLRKDPKAYVKGVVREGSQPYRDVGIRLKGGGQFQGFEQKPGLTLKFNEFVQGQKFHGHSRILLGSSKGDPTYLGETLAAHVFNEAGVPAARSTFARVELNGREAGLYVINEAVTKDFLAHHFKKSKGNLYEGSNNEITDRLEKDSGDESTDQKDLRQLAKAAQEPDLTQRWKKLGTALDLDRFVSFTAAEVYLWHREGYSMDRNNFRVYGDPNSGLMVFLPHGVDQVFTQPTGALWPEWKGLVARAVLETPEGRQRYLERMATILAGPGKPETLSAKAQELAALLRPALSSKETAAFDSAVKRLREGIAQRATHLQAELKKSAPAAP